MAENYVPKNVDGLSSWRDVIEPHADVATGQYSNAEFAASLALVAHGGGRPEYSDPAEFFRRTYVTDGLASLLRQALRRVCGKGGESVIHLQTAFGGGKTHSMLALYHIMSGWALLDKNKDVERIFESAGVEALPKVNIAVLDGVALNPVKSRRPGELPGVTVNTFWGEMAAQLAISAGNPALYDYVKEEDNKGRAPGSEVFRELFDAAAPCMILMDELVNYAKRLYGKSDLPAGTFENFTPFIHIVTEAAKASKNCLLVATIPESDIEVGGGAGKIVLNEIERIFGRVETTKKPVKPEEGFGVVRRRLFADCKNTAMRDKVCEAFSAMYQENDDAFPIEATTVKYRERMIDCYPIHPDVFDRLYKDWSTIDSFQSTRGVLQLMAAVIHKLWMDHDAGLMIMPGSFPFSEPGVRDELMRHLGREWNAVMDGEVDGENSIPFKKDELDPRFGGKSAARRVARAVMLGSAPAVGGRNVRGIDAAQIRLGVIPPSDGGDIHVFNDALEELNSSLKYLYSDPSGSRFWYDTHPTLRKTMEDRATQIQNEEAEREVEERLRKFKKEPPFAGVHVCPASSLDVPDEQSVRLVILCPADEYDKNRRDDCAAMKTVQDMLDNRGDKSTRIYRNMLAFVAPDQGEMASLKQAVRAYLAWKYIEGHSVDLNLNAAQNIETRNSRIRAGETVDARVRETYCWLLVPSEDNDENAGGDVKKRTIEWERVKISGGSDGIVTKAASMMLKEETIIKQWASTHLKKELDHPRYSLWGGKDNIAIGTLWEYFCTYCYLPRLAEYRVLETAIRDGLKLCDFAYAARIDGGKYVGLMLNRHVDTIERSGYLVKISAAQKQIDAEEEARRREQERVAAEGSAPAAAPSANTYQPPIGSAPPTIEEVPKNTAFYMCYVVHDKNNIYSGFADCVGMVGMPFMDAGADVQIEVNAKSGAAVEIEVNARFAEGFASGLEEKIRGNCEALKAKKFGFS